MSSHASTSRSNSTTSTIVSSRSSPAPTSQLESVITRLLVATKQLLEGLAKWSRGEMTEDAISAIYVKLGNDFNVACAAFDRENISMNELLSVPSDLRVCLETCLSDTPSQATLERHLPQVRQIIIGLLTGLREKQKLYREGVALRRAKDLQDRDAAQKARENATSNSRSGSVSGSSLTRSNSNARISTSNPSDPNNQLTPGSAGRSRDQLRKFVTQTQSTSGSQSLPNTRSSTPSSSSSNYVPPPNSAPPPIPPPNLPPSPPRSRIAPDPPTATPIARNPPPSPSISPSITPRASVRQTSSIVDDNLPKITMSRSSTSLRESNRSSRSTDGTDSFMSLPSLPSSNSLAGALGNFSPQRANSVNKGRRLSPPPPKREEDDRGPVPTTPTEYQNVESFPFPLPAIVRSPSMNLGFEDPFSPTLDGNQDAAQLRSLENLKSSDNLSRRASKRYSAYAIQKITTGNSPARIGDSLGSSNGASSSRNGVIKREENHEGGSSAGRELSGLEEKRVNGTPKKNKSEFRPSKTSDGEGRSVPPLPTSSSYEGNLRTPSAVIQEESELSPPRWSTTPSIPRTDSFSQLGSPAPSFTTSLPNERPSPASTTSTLPVSESNTTTPTATRRTRPQPSEDSEVEPEYPISVYLQIGRDVKKAKLDTLPTVAALRVHFIERFQYNPGQADFPSIYLRDPVIGVQYELEDMSEVKNGSVLSLNIDPVEQVKLHFDQGLSSVSQELKDLRATFLSNRRASIPAFNSLDATLLSPPVPRPSERQFQDAAKNVLKSSRSPSLSDASAFIPPVKLDRSASIVSNVPLSPSKESKTVVTALKHQHEEIQNLRRELGVLRQVYVDFADSTKSVFATMRAQTSHVRNLGATKVSTSRAFIVAGKAKLETDSTDLIVKGDDLQDAIDEMRLDISVRKIRPRPGQVAELATTIKSVKASRDELVAWIATVKPSWKGTWSEELETIISEQQLLEGQEMLLNELEVDLRDAEAVFENIQQVAIRSKSGTRPTRDFAPNPISDQHGGGLSTVLLEVRGLNPDANRRLEAIAKSEKARELNIATKKDDFADELGGFVAGGRLKKSGGIEEAERLRQMRSEQTLKNMFSSS